MDKKFGDIFFIYTWGRSWTFSILLYHQARDSLRYEKVTVVGLTYSTHDQKLNI